MAAKQDVEKGNSKTTEPLILQEKQGEAQIQNNNGGLHMVLLSTFVAVNGAFEFGSCAGFSAPAQYGIMDDLGPSHSQRATFGSILSIGAMIGAISSGWIVDCIGQKGAMRMASMVCIAGFLLGYGIGVFSYVVPVFIAETTPKNHRGTLATANQVGVGLMVFQQFGGYNGIVFYANQIFVSAGVPPNLGNILYSSLQVIVTALGASLIDRLGRRALLLVSAVGLPLGCLITGSSFFLKAHQLAPNLVPILALTGMKIFPLHVKAIGGSLVTLANWTGAWAVSYTFNLLMNWSSHGTFFGYAFVCAAAVVFTIMVVPETKGRTLEEIQASMNG